MTVTVAEAQARLPELIAGLQPGEALTLTQDDRPVAELVGKAPPAPPGQRPPNLKLRAALAELRALPEFPPTPAEPDYLKEGRESGEIYGYVE
ncbi:MAG: hypothetical protein K2X82_33760 [Gemmataceae bacterium]|nr:hypothetical protein [Gemmataceae bacterium]